MNVERVIMITLGLATAGGIGAAVYTTMGDDEEAVEAEPEAPAEAAEAPDPYEMYKPKPRPATPTAPEKPQDADEASKKADEQTPDPAVEVPSWE